MALVRRLPGLLHGCLVFCCGVALALGIRILIDVEAEVDQLAADLSPPVRVHQTRLAGFDGRTLMIEAKVTRNRTCALTASTQFDLSTGPIVSLANPNKVTLLPGETEWIRIIVQIPAELLPAGQHQARSVAEYICAGGVIFIVTTDWVAIEVLS